MEGDFIEIVVPQAIGNHQDIHGPVVPQGGPVCPVGHGPFARFRITAKRTFECRVAFLDVGFTGIAHNLVHGDSPDHRGSSIAGSENVEQGEVVGIVGRLKALFDRVVEDAEEVVVGSEPVGEFTSGRLAPGVMDPQIDITGFAGEPGVSALAVTADIADGKYISGADLRGNQGIGNHHRRRGLPRRLVHPAVPGDIFDISAAPVSAA